MYEIDKHQFGAFVAQLRKEQGLTQKELAQRLYISDKAISKWETGVSIPDVALLIPLAQILGVTVTELLQCQRLPQAPMDSRQVEELVKTAITYSEEEKTLPDRKQRLPILLAVLAIAALETALVAWLCRTSELIVSNLLLTEGLMAFFCVYFLLFMQQKLPRYYDENEIRYFNDGFLRMNVPGITFNNRNWPHIRRAGTIGCLCILLGYPLLFLITEKLIPAQWVVLRIILMVAAILGGLFIPMYTAGRRHRK